MSTVEHFSYYLYGRQFKALTDHKPLVHLMTSDRLNSGLRRMVFKLQHWMVAVEYLPGKDNTMADALSREERPRAVTPRCSSQTGRQSCGGGCGGRSPTRERREKRGEQRQCGSSNSHMKCLCGKPCTGEYPGKKIGLFHHTVGDKIKFPLRLKKSF